MELSDELLQQIDDYLNNRLAPDARAEFEAQMTSQPVLQAEVVTQRRLLNAMATLKTKQKLKEAYQQYALEAAQTPKVRPLPWTTYAVAASVVGIMVTAAYFATNWFKPNTEVAFNQYYQPEVGARGDCPQDLPAFKLYEQKQYQAALLAAQALPDDSTHCISYFMGLNFLATNQFGNAILSLQVAQQSSSLTTRRKAAWYLGLAYLQANDAPQAERVFRKMVSENDPENPYLRPATNILKQFF